LRIPHRELDSSDDPFCSPRANRANRDYRDLLTDMPADKTQIVILGGGFGGVYTAKYLWQSLRREERARTQIVLVSSENYLVFQPMLPEVISGTLETLHVISPIRRIVPNADLYVRAVEEVDLEQRRIRLAPGYSLRHLDLRYDHLVFALGNQLARGLVAGLDEHAIPFKYLGDALRLRNHLVHVLEEAAIANDPVERQRLLTFVVAGGGFSGVECIAEMHDFLVHAIRAYPSLKKSDLRTVLLQSADHILPEMKPSLAQFAHKLLVRRGVEIQVNTRLTAVTELAAVVSHKPDGRVITIPTRTVVATVPVEPHPLVAGLPLPKAGGRISVSSFLHCEGLPNIWAVGDCAAIPLGDGRTAPPTAQHAIREARQCARNIVATLRHTPLKPFAFESLGSLASLGRRSAVADVMGIRLSGILAWILWRMVYLAKFPGLDRRARILADWTMDLFLPRDITEVRIFRQAQVLREHFEPGEDVFRQGDIGDRIYFVIDGEADVVIDGRVCDSVGGGGVFGEIALMNDSPRTATIRARTAMNLASVRRETFHTLVSHFPGVKAAMEELLADRIISPARQPPSSIPTVPSAST
jgi:NADH:quinone reductase (non-electrogenic)